MSWLSDLFGTTNPADKAMPYMEKAYGQLGQGADVFHQGYDPYVQQGQSQYNNLNQTYGQMAQDPAGYLEKMMQGYKPSESYQQKFGQMSQAAGNTAAAGGMRGSLQDIQNQSGIAQSLMGDDMQQWLQNVFGLQNAGLQGQQGLYDTGYNASQNLTQGLYGNLGDLANSLQSQGSMAFQGQSQKNANTQNMWNNAIKAAGGIAGLATGNPMGLMGMMGGGGGNTQSYQPFSANSPYGQRGWL